MMHRRRTYPGMARRPETPVLTLLPGPVFLSAMRSPDAVQSGRRMKSKDLPLLGKASPDTFFREKVSKTRRAGDFFRRALRSVLRCKNNGPPHFVNVNQDPAGEFLHPSHALPVMHPPPSDITGRFLRILISPKQRHPHAKAGDLQTLIQTITPATVIPGPDPLIFCTRQRNLRALIQRWA